MCVWAYIQETDAVVDEHVLVGATGEDGDRPVVWGAPVPADERGKAHQLSSRGREAGRRQRVSGGEVVTSGRVDARAGGGIPVESRRQQVTTEVNEVAVSSGMDGERMDRVQSAVLGTACTGSKSLSPCGRVVKRSAAVRVVILSLNGKRWVDMVRGRKAQSFWNFWTFWTFWNLVMSGANQM